MLVAIEKHARTWIIQLVHLIKVRHLSDVNQIDDGKVFYFLGNFKKNLKTFR